MQRTNFRIDPRSLREAAHVIAALQKQQNRAIEIEIPRLFRSFTYGFSVNEVGDLFSSPLRRLKEEISLDEVEADTEDFGMLSAIADKNNSRLPMMRCGLRTVPVLPPRDALKRFKVNELFSLPVESILEEVVNLPSDRSFVMRPATTVKRIFFARLKDFVAARLAGVRWARRQTGEEASTFRNQSIVLAAGAGAGGGGGMIRTAESPGYRSMQEWTIHTKGHGNSIYYGGTHAIRTEPIYLNAPTTPVQVFLPAGTLFLAADAGPAGEYVWDRSIVEVPSLTPVFKTKKF